MNLSHILNSVQLSPQSKTVMEILQLNEQTKENGLVLKEDEVKTLIIFRNNVLRDHARVELGTEVLKALIEVFSTSSYIHQENFVETLNELQEIFYYLRNETEDKIGDLSLIHVLSGHFNGPCAGSLELLRSTMEEYAENFRKDLIGQDLEGEDKGWN